MPPSTPLAARATLRNNSFRAGSMDLTTKERDALQQARIAVFRDRVITEAQPPIDEPTLARIAKLCDGALPPELVALWRTAFGGSLGYDLRVRFGEHEARLSFSELFFPESHGYRDLWGWIEHEQELAEEGAQERGEPWSGLLAYLPFGGFEYLERVYVETTSGAGFGRVVVWQKGLPPAWTFSTHEDSQARLAPNVHALFDLLQLERDPWTADPNTHPTGLRTLEAIDALEALGPAGKTAADKLFGLMRSTILDWRGALKSGRLAGDARLRVLALEKAAQEDDVELMAQLRALGCQLDEPLSGGASALGHALSSGSSQVSRLLLDAGVSVKGALRAGAHHVDLEMARELLFKGDVADQHAIFAAVNAGHVEVAELLLNTTSLDISLSQLATLARSRAAEAELTAKRIESGSLSSNMTSADELRRAARLNELAAIADRKAIH